MLAACAKKPSAELLSAALQNRPSTANTACAFQHAQRLSEFVHAAVANAPAALFRIEPQPDLQEVDRLLRSFADHHVVQGHSLTDAVIDIAQRERDKHRFEI